MPYPLLQIATMVDAEEEDAFRAGGTNYRLDANGAYRSEETQMGTGPDLAALFIVQGSGKTPCDNNANTLGAPSPVLQPPSYSSVSICACVCGAVSYTHLTLPTKDCV